LAEDLKIKDQWEQAKKTYDLAKKYAYTGIKEGEAPSEEYKKKGWDVSRREITLAGYRLADYFKEIFHKSDALPPYADLNQLRNTQEE
jgi:hypothetical protein